MTHPYRLDAPAEAARTSAAALARDVLARHASATDSAARFPEESLAALAGPGSRPVRPARAGREGRGACAPSPPSSRSWRRACGSTAMVYVMHVTAAQAIAAAAALASRDDVLRADRRRAST